MYHEKACPRGLGGHGENFLRRSWRGGGRYLGSSHLRAIVMGGFSVALEGGASVGWVRT